MLTVRRDPEIFEEQGDWFHARWHFSFDRYYDPEHMGVGALRVFNDDRIVPGSAWPMHPHRDIESLTYVVEGQFTHVDSLGNDGRLEAGAAQVMDFGHEGALHSERNASTGEPVRFIQFWIMPSDPGLPTRVQQRQYTGVDRTDRWLQIMGPAGEGGLDLAQDARVLVSRVAPGRRQEHTVEEGRGGYAYVIGGAGSFDDLQVGAGDAGVIEGRHRLQVAATEETEMILVDVPLRYRPVGVWAR